MVLYSQNFAYAKFREYKNFAKVSELTVPSIVYFRIKEDVSKSYAFNTEIIYYKVQGLTGKVDPPLTVSFKPFDVRHSTLLVDFQLI